MFGYDLHTLPRPAKWLATSYLLGIAVGYVYAIGNIALVVGLSRTSIVKHYHGEIAPPVRRVAAVPPVAPPAAVAAPGAVTPPSAVAAGAAAGPKKAAGEEEISLEDEPAAAKGGPAGAATGAVTRPVLAVLVEDPPTASVNRPTFKSLVGQGHFHSLGMSSFFFGVCVIALFISMPSRWKSLLVALPFVAIILDNGSFLLTRFLGPEYAWLAMISGGLMAAAFATIFFLSLYQMWLWKPKPEVAHA